LKTWDKLVAAVTLQTFPFQVPHQGAVPAIILKVVPAGLEEQSKVDYQDVDLDLVDVHCV
jgi:hypothetical protein